MTNRILHTDRLLIRPLQESDLDLAIQMNTDPLVMKYLKPIQTREEVIDAMPRWLSLGEGTPDKGIWIMVEKATEVAFGCLALVDMPKSDPLVEPVEYTGDIEIGYRSIPSHWGRGFTTEGARRLVDFTFGKGDLDKIVACTDDGNDASQNALKKIGLSDLGRRWVYGEDTPYFEITRDDWLKQGRNGTSG